MMAKRNSIPIRTDPNFIKEIKEIQTKRLQIGKDELLKPMRAARITLAITRHPEFSKMKKDIIKADLK